MTDFEKWFNDDWSRLLEETKIPREHMTHPESGQVSWDRRAAWLLYLEMKKTGRAGPVQDDLFGGGV